MIGLQNEPYWWASVKGSRHRHIRKVGTRICLCKAFRVEEESNWDIYTDGTISFKHVCKKCYRIYLEKKR